MRQPAVLLFLLLCWAVPVLANAPDQSLRPIPRPGTGTAPETPADPVVTPSGPVTVTVRATQLAPRDSLRPMVRPGRAEQVTPLPDPAIEVAELPPVESAEPERPRRGLLALLSGQGRRDRVGTTAVRRSLRPQTRPEGLVARVRAAASRSIPSQVAQSGERRGALCGVRGIVGDRLSPVSGRISGCGISEPVRVREIDGISLSTPATINCDAARALQEWLRDGVVPAVGRTGGGVNSIRVVASYSCRTRNSQAGARLSEHALGNAVDVAAVGLVNGREIAVLSGWGNGAEGRALRQMHESACGTFGTVLGPNSDRYHQDHFHLDVASYRSGPYCR